MAATARMPAIAGMPAGTQAIASTSETITSISKEGRQQEHKTLAKESLFEGTQAKL
jgi:hypothetical protein